MSGEIDDELYEDAVRIIRQAGRVTVLTLQRNLRIPYVRASHLLDLMEQNKIISPKEGLEPRKIL